MRSPKTMRVSAIAAAVAVLTLLAAGGPASAAVSDWMPQQLSNWPTVASRTTSPDETLTSGVTHRSDVVDTVSGREPVNVVDADVSNSNVRIRVGAANDSVVSPADQAITAMSAAAGAVAAVNGGYFQINASGEPNDGEIVDGEIWKSPNAGNSANFAVTKTGSVQIGRQETFTGSITAADAATHALSSVNWHTDATGDGITKLTPREGAVASTYLSGSYVEAVGSSSDGGATIAVSSVSTVTSLAALPAGQYALLGGSPSSAGGAWITAHVKAGDIVRVAGSVSPDADLQQLVQGPAVLLQDGAEAPGVGSAVSGTAPRTAIGVTASGHVVAATFDGHGTESQAVGLNGDQVAGYMQSLGVTQAVELDGGGSTEMAVRHPGDTALSVANTPSDGHERPIGNAIFFSSTAPSNGAPAAAVVNGDAPVRTSAGAATAVRAYAVDSAGNPTSAAPVTVSVSPASLGSWSGGVFTAGTAGTGTITATAGGVSQTVPVTVAAAFDTLAVNPSAPDLANGATQALTVTGTSSSVSETIQPSSVIWGLSRSDLGSVDSAGVFHASATGSGLVTATATVGTSTASAQIAVGTKHQTVDPVDDASTWAHHVHGGTTSSALSTDTGDVPPGSGATASVMATYTMPLSSGVHQLVMWPSGDDVFDVNSAGQAPTSVSLQVRIDDPVHSGLEFMGSLQEANGQNINRYRSDMVYGQWQTFTIPIPAGAQFPLSINYFDLLSLNPTAASSGTIHISTLTADYAPQRPSTTSPVTPAGVMSQNPSWLRHVESASEFSADGDTFLFGDDAHMVASDPGSASSVNMDHIAARVNGRQYTTSSGQTVQPLPASAKPDMAQFLGDMSDNADMDNLRFAKSKMIALGVPFHDLAGNHETTQGTVSEAQNFFSVFGPTHYSYVQGAATFIALDNAHGGITSSDAYQNPAGEQYQWLLDRLDQVTTKDVIVGVHMPAYDPTPSKDSQFTDRWEAKQYLQILQNYKAGHPQKNVIAVYGHARGYYEQLIDVNGAPATAQTAVPQFTIADLGMPAYDTAQNGGYYHFGLMHVASDGTIQYTVEPLLSSLSIQQGSASAVKAVARSAAATVRSAAVSGAKGTVVPAGGSIQLSATGVNQQGDNGNPAVGVPIADPVSHVWSSADPSIASVDRSTGVVTGRRGGTTVVTLEAGGISTTEVVTVTVANPGSPGTGQGGAGTTGSGGGNGTNGSPGARSGHDASGADVNTSGFRPQPWGWWALAILGAGVLAALVVTFVAYRRRARGEE